MTTADSGAGTSIGQRHGRLGVETRGRGFTDVTARVARQLGEWNVADGLVTLFLRHTSASLVVQENTDPDVLADLADALDRVAPVRLPYRHGLEGPDDMPAHIKAMVTGVSLSIPVEAGRMALGTWQAVYVTEHRAQAHRREIALHYIGSFG